MFGHFNPCLILSDEGHLYIVSLIFNVTKRGKMGFGVLMER